MPLKVKQFGNGPDLVLLHGWGFHSGIWGEFADILVNRYRVMLIDLPGFGCSDPIEAYTINEISTTILKQAPKQASYLGWSLGGLVAMHIARHHPKRCKQLIGLSTSPRFLEAKNWAGMRQSALQRFSDDLSHSFSDVINHFIALQFHGLDIKTDKLRDIKKELLRYGNPSQKTLEATHKLLHITDMREDLSMITCPQHYIFGKLDVIVPIETETKIKELNPNITTSIIDHSSHAPFLVFPQKTAKIVEEVA